MITRLVKGICNTSTGDPMRTHSWEFNPAPTRGTARAYVSRVNRRCRLRR